MHATRRERTKMIAVCRDRNIELTAAEMMAHLNSDMRRAMASEPEVSTYGCSESGAGQLRTRTNRSIDPIFTSSSYRLQLHHGGRSKNVRSGDSFATAIELTRVFIQRLYRFGQTLTSPLTGLSKGPGNGFDASRLTPR